MNVEMPADVVGPVTTMFSLVDPAGASVKAGRTTLLQPPTGQPYSRFRRRCRQEVHAARRVGRRQRSCRQPRQAVARARAGNFTASQIFGWLDIAIGRTFARARCAPAGIDTLHASIEIYPDDAAAMATDIAVKFELTKIGDKAPVLTRDVHPSATGTVLSASSDVPFRNLPSGHTARRVDLAERRNQRFHHVSN